MTKAQRTRSARGGARKRRRSLNAAAGENFGTRWLSTRALCRKLDTSRVSLWRAVRDGRLPQPSRKYSRRHPLWSERLIDEFLEQ
jgi:predicted DNA-binding transcriptional regulator AlpA